MSGYFISYDLRKMEKQLRGRLIWKNMSMLFFMNLRNLISSLVIYRLIHFLICRSTMRNCKRHSHKKCLVRLLEHMSSPLVLSWVIAARSLVFFVVFCRSLFVPLPFFIWPLYCLSFFYLWLLVTTLVS